MREAAKWAQLEARHTHRHRRPSFLDGTWPGCGAHTPPSTFHHVHHVWCISAEKMGQGYGNGRLRRGAGCPVEPVVGGVGRGNRRRPFAHTHPCHAPAIPARESTVDTPVPLCENGVRCMIDSSARDWVPERGRGPYPMPGPDAPLGTMPSAIRKPKGDKANTACSSAVRASEGRLKPLDKG
jgi:hypothetical protein